MLPNLSDDAAVQRKHTKTKTHIVRCGNSLLSLVPVLYFLIMAYRIILNPADGAESCIGSTYEPLPCNVQDAPNCYKHGTNTTTSFRVLIILGLSCLTIYTGMSCLMMLCSLDNGVKAQSTIARLMNCVAVIYNIFSLVGLLVALGHNGCVCRSTDYNDFSLLIEPVRNDDG